MTNPNLQQMKNDRELLTIAHEKIAHLNTLVNTLTTHLNMAVKHGDAALDQLEKLTDLHDANNPVAVVLELERMSNHRKAALAKRVH